MLSSAVRYQRVSAFLYAYPVFVPFANLPHANAQNPGSSHRKADTLLLVPLAQMRSGTYVDFREGPLTLVNLVVVGD